MKAGVLKLARGKGARQCDTAQEHRQCGNGMDWQAEVSKEMALVRLGKKGIPVTATIDGA